jgi:hypothetical protein
LRPCRLLLWSGLLLLLLVLTLLALLLLLLWLLVLLVLLALVALLFLLLLLGGWACCCCVPVLEDAVKGRLQQAQQLLGKLRPKVRFQCRSACHVNLDWRRARHPGVEGAREAREQGVFGGRLHPQHHRVSGWASQLCITH